MKLGAFWKLAKYMYREFIRDILLKAIDDPDAEWDNVLMLICDRIFDYPEPIV